MVGAAYKGGPQSGCNPEQRAPRRGEAPNKKFNRIITNKMEQEIYPMMEEEVPMPALGKKPRIGISVGDINGIGLEVILKSLEDPRMLEFCTPVLYGSAKAVFYHRNIVKLADFQIFTAKNGEAIEDGQINVINCWPEGVRISLGQVSEEAGRCAKLALEQAAMDLKAGYIDGLVTAPIHKKSMQLAGFEHIGHTEFLTQAWGEGQVESLMLMVSEDLRIGLVTNHLPIAKVASSLTQALVLEKIRLMDRTLRQDFGLSRPKIAVLGLNPHAGDEGAIGTEELDLIIPAIMEAKELGCMALGPYAADGFFRSGNYKYFDGILAMYHDQGLIPFKALSEAPGVNYTAGLPFIRTSPDHGTGFDIAGRNVARPDSFMEALFMALELLKNRANYAEMTANPLERTLVETGEDEEIIDEDMLQQQRGGGRRRGSGSGRANRPSGEQRPRGPRPPQGEGRAGNKPKGERPARQPRNGPPQEGGEREAKPPRPPKALEDEKTD